MDPYGSIGSPKLLDPSQLWNSTETLDHDPPCRIGTSRSVVARSRTTHHWRQLWFLSWSPGSLGFGAHFVVWSANCQSLDKHDKPVLRLTVSHCRTMLPSFYSKVPPQTHIESPHFATPWLTGASDRGAMIHNNYENNHPSNPNAIPSYQWIGLRGDSQENPHFPMGKSIVFRVRFSQPIHWYSAPVRWWTANLIIIWIVW